MNHHPSPSADAAGNAASQSHSSTKPKVRLSCEACRLRKVKCDKLNPCTNCQRLGTRCVPVERARLPRGRSGRLATERPADSDVNLKDRVSKLEGIIRDLARGGSQSSARAILSAAAASEGAAEQHQHQHQHQRESSRERSSEGENPRGEGAGRAQPPDTYLGSSFWANLLNEVPDVHPNERPGDGSSAESSHPRNYHRLLSMASGVGESTNREQPGALHIHHQLARIFVERVDPLCKILHRPSLKSFLVEGKPYLDYEMGHLAPSALAYSIYYAASCSLSDEESMRVFGISKATMVARYQKEAESALARADFIITNDLTVLQAYVLFLLALRSQDQSRRMWTMLSLALRIAQALSLHIPNPPFPVRPFERQLRRRLWLAIGFLDIQASMDRASEPMMQASWLETHPPANVNDIDLSPNMEANPPDSPGFTDMTFTMMIQKAQYVTRSLNFSDFTEPSVNTLAIRQQLVIEFQQTVSRLLRHSSPDKIPFQWLTRSVAECTHASMQLITLRPLQRAPNFTPPHIRSERLLEFAVNVLVTYHRLRADPRGLTWHWIKFAFPPWHSLAVAIAELCVCEDLALMERFWDPVELAFDELARLVADTSRGMLWRPMEKIMDRARVRRAQLLAGSGSGSRSGSGSVTGPSPSSISGPGSIPISGPSPAPGSSMPTYSSSMDIAPAPPMSTHPSPMGFTPGLDQGHATVMAIHTPESVESASAWPCVWDAVDFNNPGPGNEMAWTSYENFLADLYVNVDHPLMYG
ncbi:hypothetical protein BO70DRAFT_430218 [Aspergillus heteromorphus CBS 117.55]|uniref:Zn(2)-C6 fungal-type domain-containing protein n=1 Tax=Aspergillus heteromorphus CBS 117.55 TaxID=1448321 RepID=A0A317VVJ0_9EURO|nr:uncharacterized protein BO70DRAFT_430218 [Aspergillus heteromorphus CBS 117.55]PWY78313.1 hypothetical protein BO70DRAFT_430218 [Aspergillus heteromorphus CBS 117.55]